MVMLMDKSCFALVAQILPCCCFVAALSLPSPLVRAVSEEGITRARCRSCSSSDRFHKSFYS
jgi:hypothetical protein